MGGLFLDEDLDTCARKAWIPSYYEYITTYILAKDGEINDRNIGDVFQLAINPRPSIYIQTGDLSCISIMIRDSVEELKKRYGLCLEDNGIVDTKIKIGVPVPSVQVKPSEEFINSNSALDTILSRLPKYFDDRYYSRGKYIKDVNEMLDSNIDDVEKKYSMLCRALFVEHALFIAGHWREKATEFENGYARMSLYIIKRANIDPDNLVKVVNDYIARELKTSKQK